MIQIISFCENPLQRRFRLATLTGSTGALAFPPLRDVDRPVGEQVLEWASGRK
jgi:hypothetical protein